MPHTRHEAAVSTRRTLIVAVGAIALGMAVMVATVSLVLDHRTNVTHRICMSQIAQNKVLRQILLVARADALRRATNEAQSERVLETYEPYLELVPVLRCDKSGKPQRVRTEGTP